MDVGLLAVLVTIYKAAEKIGLLDYLKGMPAKTFEALYEKFIQDHAAQNKFLKPLFTPEIEKAFDKALKTITPEHTPLRKELFLLNSVRHSF